MDSVDALELVMALQRRYNVHFDDQNVSRFILRSVDTIAEFVSREAADKKISKSAELRSIQE